MTTIVVRNVVVLGGSVLAACGSAHIDSSHSPDGSLDDGRLPEIVEPGDLQSTVACAGTPLLPSIPYTSAKSQSVSSPSGVATGDFNGDGKLDVASATAFAGESGVTVLLGKGDGSFGPPKTYGTSRAVQVHAGDFNRDGKLDLASANGYDQNVSILIGKGDGTFQPPVNFRTAVDSFVLEPWDSVMADFNKDGNPDIAVMTRGSLFEEGVSVFLGDGTGTLKTPTRYRLDPTGFFSPDGIAVGDFNGDGAPDMIVWSSSRAVVLFGQGNGTFQVTEQPALVNNGFIPGDVNHDGKVDLIGTKVFLGQADSTFKAVSGDPLIFQGPTVVADFDGDNALDFFAGATLWKGNGQGAFQVAGSFNFMDGTTATGDFNGDGRIDVVRCDSADVGVLLNSGNGRFDGPLKLDDRPNGPVLARDVNSDGEIDLVATTSGTKEVNVFLGRAGGQFDPAVNYSAGNNAPTALAAADFNGDRRLDLVTANGAGNDVSVLLGTGGGKFAAPTSFAVGTKPSAVATGDFNGDMKPDLAFANSGSDDVSILLGDDAGGFKIAATPIKVGVGPTNLAARDFNGDGKLDLAIGGVRRYVNKQAQLSDLRVLLGNGDGTFQSGFVEPKIDSAVMTIGDFNHDGKLDIVSVDSSYGRVFVGTGDGTFTKLPTRIALAPFSGRAPTAAVAGDLDGDGHFDLAVVLFPKLSLARGNGDGTFKDAVHYSAGRFTAMAGGDFDHNGTIDLAGAGPGLGLNVLFQTGCLH